MDNEGGAYKAVITALRNTLKRRKIEDTNYNRYEVLKGMRDNWLDGGVFTDDIKQLITATQNEIYRLRALMPAAYNELEVYKIGRK